MIFLSSFAGLATNAFPLIVCLQIMSLIFETDKKRV